MIQKRNKNKKIKRKTNKDRKVNKKYEKKKKWLDTKGRNLKER